jgi:hypothetical protein
METTWNMLKYKTGKLLLTLLTNCGSVVDPETAANAFNTFLLI